MRKAKRGSDLEKEYREYVKTTATWQLIDDLIHLRKKCAGCQAAPVVLPLVF